MKDDVQMAQPPQPPAQPKEQVDMKKRQQSEFDNKLMNYFSEEFFKRKLEIAPKRNPMETDLISEDYDKISSNAKLFRYLQQIEKEIDNKIFKSRLDLQEKLVIPSQKVKALLRTHICSYLLYESNDIGEIKTYFQMRIQGKVMAVLDQLPGGTYHKFTHYFQKIIIKFSSTNENKYQDIEWTNPNLSSYNSTIASVATSNDIDGFDIKRPLDIKSPVRMKIFFYLNYPNQEYKLKPALAELLGITQETRPRILYHMWQYIKINSLQDNESPNVIINNKPLQRIFLCEKMDITSLTARLVDQIQPPDPIDVDFTVNLNENLEENQILKDIVIPIEDPHFNDVLNLLSNIDNESLLFPNHINMNGTTPVDNYMKQIGEYDKKAASMIDLLKRHKYKYDFYEAYAKDPIRFINNFIIQQNTLIRMVDESSYLESRSEYTSSQYYKDYEEVLREYVNVYLEKKAGNSNNNLNTNNVNINK